AVGGAAAVVGVFVDAGADEMNAVAGQAGLDLVQLHGRETPALLSRLVRPAIKALAVAPDLEEALAAWTGVPLLLDAHDPVRHGGTGSVVDWDRAATVARRRPVILAGGLRPENIGEALARV